MKQFWLDLKNSALQFGQHKIPRLAAALAYYTVFSLAPLLIIVIGVIGLVYGTEDARQQLVAQLELRVGADSAGLIETMIERTAETGAGVLATFIGIATLLLGATTVFAQLQMAMNEIWDVPADRTGGIRHLLVMRLRGLGMVLLLGFLLLLSFILQAALNVVVSNFAGVLPGGAWLWYLLNLLLTLALVAVVFAGIFKVLPDVELQWRDVWRGALLTAILFKIGEVLIGIYLGTSGANSAYGAAGSLVVLLLWIYFSAQILLFGAEFTQVETRRRKGGRKAGTPEGMAAGGEASSHD
ncbi:MAG: YihY/virulence factor BrkB family protein [Trueperaceae bacterium]